jgi:transcriptional regulatory protein RtcR
MATLSPTGRIDAECVEAEIIRLKRLWSSSEEGGDELARFLSPEQLDTLDPFDRAQLATVVQTCVRSRSLSEAGRSLFAVSRTKRTSANDADRLRKYLARFGLNWQSLQEAL